MRSLSGQRQIDNLPLPYRPAPDDREILFRDPLTLHRDPELPRCLRCFRHEHKAARFAIKPVNERYLTAVREFVGEQGAQLSPECPRLAGLCRMNEQKWRLINHEIIRCFRHDREVMRRVCEPLCAGG